MSDATTKWIKRWGYELSPRPVKPGVWRLRDGGYLIRARVKDPRTGKLVEIKRVLRETKNPAEAAEALAAQRAELRRGRAPEPSRIRWHEYVAQFVERKSVSGDIRSPAGLTTLACEVEHLLTPKLSDVFMDQLRPSDFAAWRAEVATLIAAGKFSPRTCNNWVRRCRQICREAMAELELPRDPSTALRAFDTTEHRTYTREQPNSLWEDQLGEFCAAAKLVAPLHYAALVLGFATGLRPSSLRPLRRQGPEADILWTERKLLVRRSYVKGRILDRTKTAADLELSLPEEMVQLLRDHVAALPPDLAATTDLLFPAVQGGLMDTSTLHRTFRRIVAYLGWQSWITPRAMRRTFQDSTRAAAVRDNPRLQPQLKSVK